jgi:hypothetical protein
MVQKASEREDRDLPGSIAESRLSDDWPLYVALLPGIISIAAAIFLASATSWHSRLLSSVASAGETNGEADGYVEGLARLGIAQLPGDDRQPVTSFGPRGGPGPVAQVPHACAGIG